MKTTLGCMRHTMLRCHTHSVVFSQRSLGLLKLSTVLVYGTVTALSGMWLVQTISSVSCMRQKHFQLESLSHTHPFPVSVGRAADFGRAHWPILAEQRHLARLARLDHHLLK